MSHLIQYGLIVTLVFTVMGCCAKPLADGDDQALQSPQEIESMLVYFGTYTKDREFGIYSFEMDMDSGVLTPIAETGGVPNPSFLAIAPDGKHLYAAVEVGKLEGKPGGGVAAFAIDGETGGLTLLNTESSQGGGACHVTIDPTGSAVIVSNYGGGSVASFPALEDGRVGPAASFLQHEGTGPDPKRQKGPHAHSVNVDPTGQYAVAADLGLDQLLIYRLNAETAELTPAGEPFSSVNGGAGPRHLAFHPDGKHAYVINEMHSTITALQWDPETPGFTALQTVGTLPDGFDGRNFTAEVVVHPNGRFLYGSNRGHDSLATYAIDPDSGLLTLHGFQPTMGKEPRNFNIDPTGRFLIACNQNSDNVQVFSINGDTGALTPAGEPVSVPMPVCVRFLPR